MNWHTQIADELQYRSFDVGDIAVAAGGKPLAIVVSFQVAEKLE
ncbi:MAG TPA: hypothetical protein VES67_06480 [Vicinamibacterales bacterium]|nr:hypothetical protein [Vicinamibacterales bacterium]